MRRHSEVGPSRNPSSSGVANPSDNLTCFRFSVGSDEYCVISMPVVSPEDWPAELTTAERQVAEGVLAGLSNRDLARQRRTSERTIANQIASLYQKLGVSSRAELVASRARGPALASSRRQPSAR